MKIFVVVLTSLLAFVGVFWGVSEFINYLVSDISNSDTRGIMKVILWICGFSFTLFVAAVLAYFSGAIVDIFLTVKRKKWKNRI